MSAAGRRVVGKFMPKFEGPYRVLDVRKNNLIIWKKGKRVTVNIYQVRVYHPRPSDTISSDSHVETLYEGHRSSRSHPEKNPKDLGKPRVRRGKPPTEGSRQETSGQYDKARDTRTNASGTNRATERRPVRSKQATAVRPCPYYLRSRVKQPEGIPEERRINGIDSIPQNNIRRKSLSMEALDGDPVDRSE
ncbi:uncharacterized protein TNCV_236311 [Trichonephila clavipes]|nr:uncharacterized protein TNCV_236311 [Trichonephila clavipes]